jgi:hypothetical protein
LRRLLFFLGQRGDVCRGVAQAEQRLPAIRDQNRVGESLRPIGQGVSAGGALEHVDRLEK